MFHLKLLILTILMLQIVLSNVPAQNLQDASFTIIVVNINDEYLAEAIVEFTDKNQKYEPLSTDNSLTFQNLKTGEYLLEIEVPGYQSFSKKIKIKAGSTSLKIKLDLLKIIENVEVKTDERTALIDNAFTGFFTKEQIEALPEEGPEIERELKRRYGPDVIIKVDGFDSRVPNKSKIASIKATQSSYDAENHELGFTYVEITTKVGEESFGGSLGYDFNNQFLNSRPTLSANKLPDSKNNFSFYLFGPIKQKRSAFDLSVFQTNNFIKTNIIAVLPTSSIPSYSSANKTAFSVDSRIYHNLSKNHNLKVSYSFQKSASSNLGVGGFDLPERAYTSKSKTQTITIAESGYLKNKYFNELRVFFQNNSKEITPNSDLPTIQVLDAFTSGGSGNRSNNDELLFWVADNFLFGYKNHAIKFGGRFEIQSIKENSRVNEKGTFLFSSLTDFFNNKPSIFTQTLDQRASSIVIQRIAGFLQDDFKVTKNLGVSAGLRYEVQSEISDFNNFSPRLGITWIPPKLQNTVIRGGVGVFYNWLESSTFSYIANRSVSQSIQITVINPPFPTIDINNGTKSLFSYWQLAKNVQNPTIFHTSIGSSSNLGKNSQLQINYVFQKGTKLLRTIDKNAPANGTRPDRNFNNIFQIESSGFYALNKLDINFSSVIKKGLTYGVNYTLQKKISDSEGIFSLPSNSLNLKADVSAANDDQRHRFSGNLNWKVKRGLLLSAIYRIDSPLPYTITTGFDDNRDTIFNDRPIGFSRNSARGEWKKQLDLGLSYTLSFWDYGEKRKGKTLIIYSGSEITRDNETIDENKRFQTKIYFSAFNIFNTSNFNNFVGVQTSPLFKQPVSANNSRKINIGIRLGF